MSKIYTSATQLIGHTPLLKVNNYLKDQNIEGVELSGKAGVFQSTWKCKGQGGGSYDRTGHKGWKDKSGHNNHRADKWQYRNRTCICGSLKGASPDTYNA